MYNIPLHPALSDWWWIIGVVLLFTAGRYLLLAGTAYLLCYFTGLKRLRNFKIQPAMPRPKQVRNEILFSFSTIFIFSTVGLIIYTLYINDHTTLYMNIHEYGWGYFALSVLAMIITHDTYFYWTHRLLHTRWLFKRIHTVHHRSVNPTPLAAYSFHPLEALIESLVVFPFVTIFPVHIAAFLVFTFLVLAMNVIGHLGFEFLPRKFRNSLPGKCITSSTHHNLHHQKSNKNFGYYFTFWDTVMRTSQKEKIRGHVENNFLHSKRTA